MTQNPFCIRLKSVFLTADFALLLHNHIYNIFRTGVQETARRFSSLLFTLLFTVALPTCAHAASSITSEDQGSAGLSEHGWDSPTSTALPRQVHKSSPETGRPSPQRGYDTPYHEAIAPTIPSSRNRRAACWHVLPKSPRRLPPFTWRTQPRSVRSYASSGSRWIN